MDDQTRITKLESDMATLRESNARLQRSVDLLHDEVMRLRTCVEGGFEKLGDRLERQGEHFDKSWLMSEPGLKDTSRKFSRAMSVLSQRVAPKPRRAVPRPGAPGIG